MSKCRGGIGSRVIGSRYMEMWKTGPVSIIQYLRENGLKGMKIIAFEDGISNEKVEGPDSYKQKENCVCKYM